MTSPPTPRPRRRLRTWSARLLHRHRPLLVAALAGLSVLAGLQYVTSARAIVTVLSVTRDLPAGSHLSPDLVHPIEVPEHLAPRGALTRMPQRSRLTGAVRSGEILTDAAVSSTGLPTVPDGAAIVPVRLSSSAARWLQPGQRVALYPPPDTNALVTGTSPSQPTYATIIAVENETVESVVESAVNPVTALVAVEHREAGSLASAADTGSLVPVFVS